MHLPAVTVPACGFIAWANNKVTDLKALGIHTLEFLVIVALLYAFWRGIKSGTVLVALVTAGAVCAIALWLGPGGGMNWGATQAVGETGSTPTSALVQPATPAAASTNGGAC